MTEPFLRDVQGRRGITDFKVVCDTSNNTGDVIDRNEFRADIYIKPARSINFITLTFVATRTGVSFSEVGA
jgi:transcriptional regulator of aromatic amino acid metabolism